MNLLLLFKQSHRIRQLLPALALITLPIQAQPLIETVAELTVRPGNVAVAQDGRVFATVHPLGTTQGLQLIEITGRTSFQPWPDDSFQSTPETLTDSRIDTPIGIAIDKHKRLWISDMGLHRGSTIIWCFDIAHKTLDKRLQLPADIAPKGSFIQDLVIDEKNGWIYLADIANPGLIAVNLATGTVQRFGASSTLQPEADAQMIIKGKPILFGGKPANVGVNPITLSADKETLSFGAMNGRHWYSVPTRLFRDNKSDTEIAAAIKLVGPKPVSDGATEDETGNMYFTNVNAGSIDILTSTGDLKTLVKDPLIDWPDGIRFGKNSWLYIAVNQLYKTPAFTGGSDEGHPPFYILRIKVDKKSFSKH